MNLVPVIHRELRVISRAKGTYWLRGTMGMLGFCAVIWIALFVGRSSTPASIGQGVFGFLTTVLTGVSILLGMFNASTSLAGERENGTLGLLFLTPLRPFEVVFGKLFSNGLASLVALLGAGPVFGITLMLGGVTLPEVVEKTLGIISIHLSAACLGLMASSISRDQTRAFFLTLVGFFVWVCVADFIDFIAGFSSPVINPFAPLFTTMSDGSLWMALVGNLIVDLVMLILASRWVQKEEQMELVRARWARMTKKLSGIYSGLPLIRYQVRKQEKQKSESWNFKDLLFRCATRMVGAEKLLTPLFWLLVISLLTAVFLLPFGVVELEELAASSFFILVLTGYGMKFFASFVAAKVFDRMLRDGEFELVAVTPVHGERFLLQFGEAFSRIFRDFFSKLFSVLLVLLLLVSVASLDAGSISGIVGLLVWALYLAADIGALIWMSMHGVLKGRSPRSSILYGLFMVQIVPYLVLIVPFCGFFLLAFSPLWSLWLMSHHRRQLLWNFRKFVRDRTVASV